MEEWKDCKGYEGIYMVSSLGRIWNVKRQRIVYGCLRSEGNIIVALYAKNGKKKQEYIHRLVALAFIPNPDNFPKVGHLNGVLSDNRACNLYWHNKREVKKVRCIDTGEIFNSCAEAAKVKKVHASNIGMVCRGAAKTAGGYRWEYIYD